MATETDIIYTAGLFDGEGGCHIRDAKRGFIVHTYIVNTHEGVVRWLHQTFGMGRVEASNVKNGNRKVCYRWSISNEEDVLDFLYAISPYVRIKLEVVQLVITYLERRANCAGGSRPGFQGGARPIPLEEVELRTHYREELMKLNRGDGH